MCGRFISISEEQLKEILHDIKQELDISDMKFGETFPINNSLVATNGKDKRHIEVMNWGIKTEWSKSRPIINARQETVQEKSLFKHDMQEHRCIIYASAFFEWDKDKNKFKVYRANQPVLKFAGLYKMDTNKIPHFVIITQEATSGFMAVHNRLPLMLEDSEIEEYLNGSNTGKWTKSKTYDDLKWEK